MFGGNTGKMSIGGSVNVTLNCITSTNAEGQAALARIVSGGTLPTHTPVVTVTPQPAPTAVPGPTPGVRPPPLPAPAPTPPPHAPARPRVASPGASVAEGVTPTESPPSTPSTSIPGHVTKLTTEEVVSWLRVACRLNEADCVALRDGGIDGGCLEDIGQSDLIAAGVRVLKVKTVLRVIQRGPWPPV